MGAPADEPDLAPEHERRLGEWARRTYGSDLLAVEGYPAAKRPFYTHPWTGADVPGGPWTNSFDLLFRGVELVTGGQRLHRHSEYLAAYSLSAESPVPYESYLRAFAYGMPPHGGFAIGLERWVARLVKAAKHSGGHTASHVTSIDPHTLIQQRLVAQRCQPPLVTASASGREAVTGRARAQTSESRQAWCSDGVAPVVRRHELGGGAVLDDPAVLHHQHPVGDLHRATAGGR